MKKKKKDFKKYLNFIILVMIVILLIVLFFSYEKDDLFAKCGDGKCSLTEDSDNCCLDCGCPNGYSCDGEICQKLAECGNGIKEEGETSENCCMDAGCPTGEICQNNICIELKPEIQASFTQNNYYGASILYSKNGDLSLGTLNLINSGNDNAKNIKITISSPKNYFDDKVINLGVISTNNQDQSDIKLNFNEEVLDVTNNEEVAMNIKVDYSNSANKDYSSIDTVSFTIYDKNSMAGGYPNGYVAFVTPHQNIIREFGAKSTSGIGAGWSGSSTTQQKLAARWMFESMISYGIDYVNDVPNVGDYVQLPYETLKRRNGDCEDLAVLYASLIESIGMESRIILIPGHAFAGYIDKEGYLVPIETTASSFDSALSIGMSEWQENEEDRRTISPRYYRNEYNEVLVTNEPNIPLPDITKQIGSCGVSWSWSQGWISKAEVTFTNSGNSPGAGCAAMLIYSEGEEIGEDLSCWTLNPGETETFDYIVDIGLGNIFYGYYCYVY